jgi:hypothetical protein
VILQGKTEMVLTEEKVLMLHLADSLKREGLFSQIKSEGDF